jgi:hypothetical protein
MHHLRITVQKIHERYRVVPRSKRGARTRTPCVRGSAIVFNVERLSTMFGTCSAS